MREIGPFADSDDGPYSLFWAVEGRGRKSVTLDLRTPEGQELYRRLAATADVVVENFRPGTLEQWNIGPDRVRSAARDRAHLDVRPGRTQQGRARVSTASGSATAACCTSPGIPIARRCGSASRSPTTSPACSRRRRPRAALYARDARGRRAASSSTPRSTARRSASSSGRWPRYDRLGIVRNREGNRLANSAPLDNYPTRDGKYVCIVAGSDANFARLCKAMDRPDLVADPRFTKLADRAAAQRRDQRHRRGVDRDARRDRDRGAVRRARRPGRDRLHRRRHLRRSAHAAPRTISSPSTIPSSARSANRRRSRASSASRPAAADAARPVSARTRARCSARSA